MSQPVSHEAYTDVVELCALLQCLGFSVKSLDTSDANMSQEGAAAVRTIVINCQSSGLHVVLESPSLSCSCPPTNLQNSGIWQVSGIAGGKQLDKEFGFTLLGSLPKPHRERLTKELHEMIRCIKQHNESDYEVPKEAVVNKSASMVELKTPEKRDFPTKLDTPTRYRSLDTLTAAKKDQEEPLPAPGPLQKVEVADASADEQKDHKKIMCRRQSTYTVSSTPGSVRRRNRTSSPIQASQHTLLDSLLAAEKVAVDLHNKLANVIKELTEDDKQDSSISSLALDVSKISILKGEAKPQFASSPNLSGIVTKEELTKSRLKRFDSASTSNLATKTIVKENKIASKLRRLSPSMFKSKKDTTTKTDKDKTLDVKNKLNVVLKPRIVTPVRTPRSDSAASPNLSASRKKFSHIKSTIPKPAAKKE